MLRADRNVSTAERAKGDGVGEWFLSESVDFL